MWVFGMVDTSQTPALGVMELVPRRNAATLLPIIRRHVRSGTIIWSDEWSAYSQVQLLPNVSSHQTVNHSIEFVYPRRSIILLNSFTPSQVCIPRM